MPEFPHTKRDRLVRQYSLKLRDVEVLLAADSTDSARGIVAYFEQVAQQRDPEQVLNWYSGCAVSEVLADARSKDYSRDVWPACASK